MRHGIYLYLKFYQILYSTYYFGTVEAAVGENVRSAEEHEFPFVVAIAKYVRQDDESIVYICAGSLVSRKDVLTSAHCLLTQDVNKIHVLVGSSYLDAGIRYYPKWWITFDQWATVANYDLRHTTNDIAMLNLISRVSDDIRPANVWARERNFDGSQVTIAGWGLTMDNVFPNALQIGTVHVLTVESCSQTVSNLTGRTINGEERLICTVAYPYVLLRPGDSGGPLLLNNIIIGINYGTSPFSPFELHPEQVNVHMSTYYYYDFISDLRSDS